MKVRDNDKILKTAQQTCNKMDKCLLSFLWCERGDPVVNTKAKQLVSSGSYFLLAAWFLVPVMGVGNLPLLQSDVDARSVRRWALIIPLSNKWVPSSNKIISFFYKIAASINELKSGDYFKPFRTMFCNTLWRNQ